MKWELTGGIPENVESTYFIVLCPTDEKIEQRLRARPKERGFDSDEAERIISFITGLPK